MLASARRLDAAGYRAMLLRVLERKPARGFYKRLGGARLGATKPAKFGDASPIELAYGWPSVAEFVHRLEAGPRA